MEEVAHEILKCLRPPEVILFPRWLRGADSRNGDWISLWVSPTGFLEKIN